MVKSLKNQTSEHQLDRRLPDLARQIWLAGLGAFSRIESEGSKFFESLVQEGEKFEAHTMKSASDKLGEVKGKALSAWDKLEQMFEERISQTLNRLGVPTNNDIQDLSKRVEALNESVRSLTKT